MGGAILWQISDFLSNGNSNVFSISQHLPDIRQNNKILSLTLKNEGQGFEEQDLRHSTGNDEIHIHIFQNFSHLATYVYAKDNTHTHTHTHTHKQTGVIIVSKVCKAV